VSFPVEVCPVQSGAPAAVQPVRHSQHRTCPNALMAAYQAERPSADVGLAALPLFMLARSFTYLGWVHTRSGTETAKELTPMLVDICCGLAEAYLDREPL